MATIGYATLQIIPSLVGVSEAIEKQIEGKVVSVAIEPKVDQPAAEKAGKQAKETVEKHTTQVKVEPKVDQKAAEDAGKKTGEAVTKGASESSTALGEAITGALQGAGAEAGRRMGERLRDMIPTGMTGAAERIGTALRNSLPTVGESAGVALGTAIGISLTNAIGKQRLDAAGKAMMNGLAKAVKAANTGTDIGVAIGKSVAGGLNNASSVIGGAAGRITDTVSGIGTGIDAAKQLLGGNDSWAAPGLDTLNTALGSATPLLNAMTGAASLASAGAQTISTAVGLASKAQLLWNAALIANPIGLIVAAIAAVVAGLVLFFTKTELGRKIWAGFTEYLKVAWEAIKIAFSVAWDVISGIWDGMVKGAGAVWDGIKSAFTNVVDFVKGLPRMIASVAGGMWDGISNAFKSMIDKLKGWWNGFADALSFTTPDWLPGDPVTFSLPKLSTGGYTGSMATDQVAGVVHGGEYVIKASSTNSIQNAFPGLLDYLNGKGALPGYAGGGLVAGTAELGKIIGQKFGISNIGGWRPQDKYGEHSTGRALDVMTSNKSTGDAVKDFAVANASAIDLKWAIWQQRIWYPNGSSKAMPDRGSPTQNHMDHVHIFSGAGITNGLRGALAASTKTAESDSGTLGATTSGMASALGIDTSATTLSTSSPVAAASTPAAAEGGRGQFSMGGIPGSMSEFGSFGGRFTGDQITAAAGAELDPRLKTAVGGLGDLGSAAGSLVDGQVGSALGVLGVNGSPGWLKGISTLIGGISVGGGASSSAVPAAATSTISSAPSAASALSTVHAGSGAQPGPGVTYNIRTATVEDAFVRSTRLEKERAASKLSRF